MMSKYLTLFLILALLTFNAFAQDSQMQESDQQISDFSLTGYAEKGKKSWDISGKSADIFDNIIKLKDVIGNLYGEKEDIKLTADKGDFDKVEGKVHLEQNVVITSSGGTKLTTDSLDWDRKNQLVNTEDPVKITRDNMVTTGKGAKAHPNLNQVTLEKEVRVDINPVSREGKTVDDKEKTIITCDGSLEIDYAKNIATFNNNVKVDTHGNLIYSDIMDVYFSTSSNDKSKESDKSSLFGGAEIEKIVCRGNVKIVHGQNVSYSEEATYTAADKKIVLTGRPKLIIYSTEELSAPFRD